MREIKFRGKRLDNGEWVYGSYVAHRTNVGADELRHLIICNETMSDQHPVDPKSVGQFIYLTDRNDTEIYEGDIVKGKQYGHENLMVVEHYIGWEGDGWPMSGFCIDFDSPIPKQGYEIEKLDVEVIGNVHENPSPLDAKDV